MSEARKQYSMRKIKYLAVSGGGWRTMYAKGVIDKLNELHILKNIEAVSVTSGGCMTGFILAFGYNPEETMKFLEKYVLNGKFSIPLYFFPEHVNSDISPYYTIKKQDHLLTKVSKYIINTTIYSYLFFKNVVDSIRSRGIFHTAGLANVLWKVMQESPTFPPQLKNKNLTFLEHHLYREQFKNKYPHLPFVDLFIIVTELTTQGPREKCYSYQTTPHESILHAACASMAIPILFRRAGNKKNLMDGCVVNNIPRNVFDAPCYFEPEDRLTEMNMRTLAICFANSENVIAKWRDNKATTTPFSIQLLAKKLIIPKELKEAQDKQHQVGANALRTLYINCSDIPALGPKTLTTQHYKDICKKVELETSNYVNCYLDTPDPHLPLEEIKKIPSSINYFSYFKVKQKDCKNEESSKLASSMIVNKP